MRLLLLALAFAAATVFGAPAAAQQQPAASPCADSLYQSLRAKPLQDLSDREYEYFMQRENACTEYQTLNRLVNAPRPAAPATDWSRRSTETYTQASTLGGGVDVYVRNVSDRPVIVNSVRVFDCVGIRDNSCAMHYPKAKIHPGQSRRVLSIRYREGEHTSYRYEYHTAPAEP